jgi:hypothetical protein
VPSRLIPLLRRLPSPRRPLIEPSPWMDCRVVMWRCQRRLKGGRPTPLYPGFETPSLRRMLLTWTFRSFGLINICVPIFLLPRPAAVPITGKTRNRGRHYVLCVGSEKRKPMAPGRPHGSRSIDPEVRACSLCGRTTNPIPPTGQPSSRSSDRRDDGYFVIFVAFLEGGYGLLEPFCSSCNLCGRRFIPIYASTK